MKPILEPVARYAQPTALDLDSQRFLAAWAIKTAYLLELAVRQQYPGAHLAAPSRCGRCLMASSGLPDLHDDFLTGVAGNRGGSLVRNGQGTRMILPRVVRPEDSASSMAWATSVSG